MFRTIGDYFIPNKERGDIVFNFYSPSINSLVTLRANLVKVQSVLTNSSNFEDYLT